MLEPVSHKAVGAKKTFFKKKKKGRAVSLISKVLHPEKRKEEI